jgi:hypothetical protein
MATATLFHPILMMIPQRWYSVKDGNVFNACIYYAISYVQNSIVYLADIKYLLIGLERNTAMKNRNTYEGRDGSDAKRLIVKAVSQFVVYDLILVLRGFFASSGRR